MLQALLLSVDHAIVAATQAVLSDLRAATVQALTETEALHSLRRARFAALIVDLHTAAADVAPFAESVRAADPELPLVFIGDSARDLSASVYELNSVAFLDRRFSPPMLRALITTFLKQDRHTTSLEARIAASTAELRASEERYRSFLSQSSEGIWRFEVREPLPTSLPVEEQLERAYRDGYLAECNDAMARMYGFTSAADIEGASLADFLPRSDERNVEYLRAFLSSGYRLTNAETREPDRSGNVHIMLNNLIGIVEDGKLLRAWGMQRDITEHKRSELALRESQSALKLAHAAAALGTWTWDFTSGEVTWSEELYQLTGLTPSEVKPSFQAWIKLVHPEDRQQAIQESEAALYEGRPLNTTFRIVRPDGSVRWLLSRAQSAGGRMVGLNIDITDRRQTEEALRQTQQKLSLLAEASRSMLSAARSTEVMPDVLRFAQRFIPADAYGIWQQAPGGAGNWQLVSSLGLSDAYSRTGNESSVNGPLPTELVVFEDVLAHEMLASRREGYISEGIRSMMCVPLRVHGHPTATLAFYHRSVHFYDEAERTVATALADLASAALTSAEMHEKQLTLFREAETAEARASLLAKAGEVLVSSPDYREGLRAIARLAIPFFADWSAVDLVNAEGALERMATEHGAGLGHCSIPPDVDVSSEAVRNRRPILVPDLSAATADASTGGLRSMVVAPMVAQDRVLGVLTFATSESGRQFTAFDAGLAEQLAYRAGAAVDNARLHAEVRAREERLRLLVRLDDATRDSTEASAITETAARLLGEHLQVGRCAYADVEDDEETFNLTGDYNNGLPSIVGRYTLAQFGQTYRQLMRSNKFYVVEDAELDPRCADVIDAYRRTFIRAVIAAPLHKAGRFVAGMAVHSAAPRVWRAEEVELVRIIANRCWESIERARVSRELRLSEQRLSAMFDQATAGFAEIDLSGRLLRVNDRFCELVGRSREQLIGSGLHTLLHPEDLARSSQLFARTVGKGVPFTRENRYVREDGSISWLSSSVTALKDSRQKVVSVLAVTVDIAERKKAEEALRRSEMYWRDLADRAPAMLWLTDASSNCTHISQRWCEFTGMALERALGAGWLKAFHPEDQDMLLQGFLDANARCTSFSIDCRIRRHDGEWRWVVDTGEPRFGPEGEFLGYIGKVFDITDRKLAEEQLRRSNDELTTANRELEEFAYVASHDLQEPLRMVNIFTQKLLRTNIDPADAAAQQYAKFIYDGVRRMEDLLSDLLSYSRTIHDELRAPATADLSRALEETLSLMAERIREAEAVVTYEKLTTVLADEGHTAQLLQNLLSNALKYRKREEAPRIHISAASQNGMYVVSVRDNGIGFDPKYAERIFGLFRRLHKDAYPGTGLGLAICKRIVERYGGKIWAESEAGVGSVFSFALPEARL